MSHRFGDGALPDSSSVPLREGPSQLAPHLLSTSPWEERGLCEPSSRQPAGGGTAGSLGLSSTCPVHPHVRGYKIRSDVDSISADDTIQSLAKPSPGCAHTPWESDHRIRLVSICLSAGYLFMETAFFFLFFPLESLSFPSCFFLLPFILSLFFSLPFLSLILSEQMLSSEYFSVGTALQAASEEFRASGFLLRHPHLGRSHFWAGILHRKSVVSTGWKTLLMGTQLLSSVWGRVGDWRCRATIRPLPGTFTSLPPRPLKLRAPPM